MNISKDTLKAIGVFATGAIAGGIFSKIARQDPDVVVLLETHHTEKNERVLDRVDWFDDMDEFEEYLRD